MTVRVRVIPCLDVRDGRQGKAEAGIADDEPSMTERLGEYQLHNIRSMVLDYPVETFAWVAAQAERARAELSVDTNSALLVALLANLLGEQAPS